MTFILMKKRWLTLQNRIQDYSSSKEIPEKNLLSVMQAGDLRIQCLDRLLALLVLLRSQRDPEAKVWWYF